MKTKTILISGNYKIKQKECEPCFVVFAKTNVIDCFFTESQAINHIEHLKQIEQKGRAC
ncbi:hypothetical protein QJU83_02345 [Pasteurella skyensis]|uniref:hypothetical protein n=1 Tax=Phocoenobacter skyensis TaxID=97481 RepID=UPI00276CC00F|nr:hypothetical protein [Pasteurella skyensis]MDP8176383.1 hypothetical protein [Pasteurella skyensis]MDP8199104.1 hypothetical protein [Pasteurella skyensis]